MFIFTAKLNKKKAIAIVLSAAVVLCVIILIAGSVSRGFVDDTNNISGISLKTNDDRIAYLNSLGWQVLDTPLEIQEIVIPREFDAVYLDYIKLQTEQGFSLEKYGGMKATRYSYSVLNYPSVDNNIVADIIIYGTTIIAGDIQCTSANGFMTRLIN